MSEIEKWTFDTMKEKVNRRFGRKLSDREIAEVAIEQLNDSIECEMSLNNEIEDLERQISDLRASQPQMQYPPDERRVSDKICEILSTECDGCNIEIMKTADGIFMDYKVYGNPLIRFPNEDEEEE